MTHDLALSGCNPTPLGSYLKGLAVHRLVAMQGDPVASSYWDGDRVFHLVSAFDRGSLLTFFLERYAPTPLVTPWNGGSGFFPNDQKAGFDAVASSKEARFAPYRAAIEGSRALLKELGHKEKPGPDAKLQLLRLARARLSDSVVEWLDAAFVLTDDVRYPALLGTGGNDGRLEFANNFMQRLAELFPPGQKASSKDAASMLEATLFSKPAPDVARKVAAGQFAPGRAGGSNMTAGLDADSRVNPWDFVLALEGSLLFAGAAVRRLEVAEYGSASYPFHVNASSLGYGSAALPDEASARAELWLPLWDRLASFEELKALFAEGRLELKGRRARTGLDAARAVASLGVDRGVETFERIGILRRNGLSYLASSLGTLRVREIPKVALLRDLDVFLGAVERMDRPSPAVSNALRRLETAMFEACRQDQLLTEVLAATGALERAVSRSSKAREKVRPLQRLSGDWYEASADGSPEFAVAAAVVSWGIREHLEPLDDGRQRWAERQVTWTDRHPLENVVSIALRRLLATEEKVVPLGGSPVMTWDSLSALLQGRLDRARLADLIFGLAVVEVQPRGASSLPGADLHVEATFPTLRAVTSPDFLNVGGKGHPSPKSITSILSRLRAHDLAGALDIARRRIRSEEFRLLADVRAVHQRVDFLGLSAALVIPLPRALEAGLIRRVVVPPKERPAKEVVDDRTDAARERASAPAES
jgi:CRISPR-associated protein Csx17